MKKEVAYNFFNTGELDEEPTIGETLQLITGACLEDNGDIWCCCCNQPNECCTCGQEGEIN